MKIYNSLGRKIEDFKSINPLSVGMYTCGPTVYDFATIGNFRTYTLADLLYRTLLQNHYDVKYVMNITDVGHLTGDNLGDSSQGEDRLEKASKKEGKDAWEIAKFYTDIFLKDFKKLNLLQPKKFVKATEHIKEQIDLIKILEKRGYTYKTKDGLYFDTGEYPDYGKLSTLDEIKEGARVEVNPEKKNPKDFALWKLSQGQKRQMEWKSPWGIGFPGWHIECSAMSMKYLGSTFDIHVGGEDLRSTHHPNEIAQSEAATSKKFVNYWVHCTFLLVNGGKMGKSLGNAYTISDIEKKGFDALALKYFYFSAHYRTNQNFTWEALNAAQKSVNNLKNQFLRLIDNTYDIEESFENNFTKKFLNSLNNDLNISEGLGLMWDYIKSNDSSKSKINSLLKIDGILGFNLLSLLKTEIINNPEITKLIKIRDEARANNNWKIADEIKLIIESKGFIVEDSKYRTKIYPKV